jgi:plasmid replication initiation protein
MGVDKMDKNYLVAKSNTLICGNTDLSVTEQKIILTLASMVQPQDDDLKTYDFRIKDFNKLLGIDGSTKYTELRAITKDLKKKVIEVYEGKDILQLSWLGGVRYRTREGIIEIGLDRGLKPYLIDLQGLYTTYKLENILKIKSKYSLRIFELLKSEEYKKKSYIITLEELKTMMKINKTYDLYTNFKTRILNMAQRELKELTDITFKFKEIKTGRKVTSIQFFIEKNENWQKSEAGEDYNQLDLLDPEDIYKIRGDAEDEKIR